MIDLSKMIEQYLVSQIKNLTQKQYGIQEKFSDMALRKRELSRKIEKEIDIPLPPTLFFENESIEELSIYLFQNHKQKFCCFFDIDIKKIKQPSSFSKKSKKIFKNNSVDRDIAIIGMAGRFAKSKNIYELWENLEKEEEFVSEIPKERWNHDDWFDLRKSQPNKAYSKWGSFLDDVDKFDSLFFGISPREAMWMDPQLRLLFEVIHETIQDAGYEKNIKGSNTGLYVGNSFKDYWDEVIRKKYPINSPYEYISNMTYMLTGRVSYTYDLHGPSIPLDNACASSLTAIHLAIRDLREKQCDMAFVAGISVILSPLHYVFLSQMGALSPTGKCHTFSEKADGYVPGEGVASLLLKPLSKAIEDNDNIHAVIKGSAINHVGKSNNPYSPRPRQQTEVIVKAWEDAGIDPKEISFIETHGTGTQIGDPVELKALANAFRRFPTRPEKTCALGALKSELGHLEAASGLASLVKIVLSFKHNKILGMRSYETPSPLISLADTPFFIPTKTIEWSADKKRIAGISAFGITGNNAHVILEEYNRENISQSEKQDKPVIIVLSAKNKSTVRKQVEELLAAIEKRNLGDEDLIDISYTLVTGRAERDYRLGILVDSIEELKEKLTLFKKDQKGIAKLFQGKIKSSLGLAIDEDVALKIKKWTSDKYEEILKKWTKGVTLKWSELYPNSKPKRISLPTYPFAKEKHWVPTIDAEITAQNKISMIHPLVHENTSDLSEQRFTSLFSGKEFFLEDHRVEERKILPGVAYLEMVYVAVKKASQQPAATSVIFRNVAWLHPIIVDNSKQVHVGLFANNNDDIQYEVYTSSDDEYVHSQGIVQMNSDPQDVTTLDIAKIKLRMNKSISKEDCYRVFREKGLNYGPGHQGLNELYQGHDEVLAKLSIPESLKKTISSYTLHPSLMDSALQASLGLEFDSNSLQLPFSVEFLEVLAPCTEEMYVWVRYSGSSSALDKVQRLDFDICDKSGKVCVKIRGFCSRTIGSAPENSTETLLASPVWTKDILTDRTAPQQYAHQFIFTCGVPEAKIERLKITRKNAILKAWGENTSSRFSECTVELFEIIKKFLQKGSSGKVLIQIVVNVRSHPLFLAFSGLLKTLSLEKTSVVTQVIQVDNTNNLISILEQNESVSSTLIKYEQNQRFVLEWKELQHVEKEELSLPFKDDGVYLITGGLGGLGIIFAEEILQKTNKAKLILVGRSPLSADKQQKLEKLQAQGCVEYSQLDIADLNEVKTLIEFIKDKYSKLNGIIHSAGIALDNLFANKTSEEFRKVLSPKVCGTENLDIATANIADLDFFVLFSSIAGAIGNIGQADYATANAFLDQFASYRNGLVSKKKRTGVTVSVNWPLWQSGGMSVDSHTKEMMRQSLGMVPMGTEKGISSFYQALNSNNSQVIVIEGILSKIKGKLFDRPKQIDCPNTPKSKTVDEDNLKSKVQSALIKLTSQNLKISQENIDIETELSEYGFDSITFIEFANQINHDYNLQLTPTIFFEYTNIDSLCDYLINEHSTAFVEQFGDIQKSKNVDEDILKNKVQGALIKLTSENLKISQENIDIETELSEYGFDSVTFIEFANQINHDYNLQLTPTIFFEYTNIDSLCDYLINEHSEVFIEKLGVETNSTSTVRQNKSIEEKQPEISSIKKHSRFTRVNKKVGLANNLDEQVAIIGMSGCFPEAKNIEQFWENLISEKNCISEIPKDRWDWEKIYGDPRRQPNKTNIKWGGFIDNIAEFDPLFFGISPREAELMDPQQRLLMTYAYQAIEDAGYNLQSISGTDMGIFVGTHSSGYRSLIEKSGIPIEGYTSTGVVPSVGPNRMSYFLNIHGPSEPIETACSSSLIAIHRAIQAIHTGNCQTAIVGGINTIVTPQYHISFNKAGMLSSDGKCKTFSSSANGYVRGEGVGMLLLKKKSMAEADGDHIYGVICGSAENHGGKSNSLTAPNPKAQKELLKTAYLKSNFDPKTIGYIEAHGTGTALGDPIEIDGLKSAFSELYKEHNCTADTPHCGIGSVKTNIGHLELAAGIAGVVKVLLQLKHQTLVKSLNCEEINPYINLDNTPFYIVQQTQKWQRIKDSSGREIPLRAGVSSFGFGGANAHVVLEEYHSSKAIRPQANTTTAVLLSAKTNEQLRQMVQNLWQFIDHADLSTVNLTNLAYTLQVGREAMVERIGFVVMSVEELQHKLQLFLNNDSNIKGYYKGKKEGKNNILTLFETDQELQQTIGKWFLNKELLKLVELWVSGWELDWNQLYRENKPQRISLPTYPFAKDRYWISRSISKREKSSSSVIHPLLHENKSNFKEQKFISRFFGREFFLSDHKIQGKKVLPAVAFLEMVRVAIENSLEQKNISMELKNIIWIHPVIVDSAQETHLHLFMHSDNQFQYEVRGCLPDGETITHCKGDVDIKSKIKDSVLDLEKIKSGTNKGVLDSQWCYQAFRDMGIDYGLRHQGIDKIYQGENNVLAKLILPLDLRDNRSHRDYVLHPSLIDSALQASIGLFLSNESASQKPLALMLPFAMESLEIIGSYSDEMYAWIRYSHQKNLSVKKLDIDLCDCEGRLCFKIKGFLSKEINAVVETKKLKNELNNNIEAVPITEDQKVETSKKTNIKEKTQYYFKQLFSKILKVRFDDIELQAGFEKYGMNSILALDTTSKLEEIFGSLSKTLFFEYQSIEELTDYFIQNHKSQLQNILADDMTLQNKENKENKAAKVEVKVKKRFLYTPKYINNASLETSEIAVVGLSGRYPQSPDIETYWQNLRNGKDCITEVPKSRWDWRDYYNEDRTQKGCHYSKWGGFIEGVDQFDPLFFNISPREAEIMDPQERLFLEHAWIAIEDAGYTRQSLHGLEDKYLSGQVGVYAAAMYSEYQLLGAEESLKGNRMGFATSQASIANRVSYVFNLHGPSMTVDTMCSSSLTSVHLACQDLKQGRIHTAIAGGVNTTIHPNKYLMLSSGQFISTRGHCESFGEGGSGYIPGEGVGVVVLKRLEDAVANRDHIYGVIKSSVLNHGGKTHGYTVPNPKAQSDAIKRAIDQSKIDPRWISYIEAHGTGTKLGDPIEIAALNQAFSVYTQDKSFCLLGSAKSNIGHCEGAAGIAGLTKVLLQMKHGQIAPSLHSKTLNPNINFAETSFVVNQELKDWSRQVIDDDEIPRIASVSSFGAGGSNAHFIVAEHQSTVKTSEVSARTSSVIVPLSAATPQQLEQYVLKLANTLDSSSKINMQNLSYTLQIGREAMEERIGFIVNSLESLKEKLQRFLAGEQDVPDCYRGQSKNRKDVLSIFTNEDLNETFNKWIVNKKLTKILSIWVNGLDFDWNELYEDNVPQRISLPTYPFSKKRYWIDQTQDNLYRSRSASSYDALLKSKEKNIDEVVEKIANGEITAKAAIKIITSR